MLIYPNTCEEIPTLKESQDYSEVLDYKIAYSVSDWSSTTAYSVDDIVYPTTRQGVYLLCIQPGISGSTEPTWNTKNRQRNTDNTIIWKTINSELILQDGETVASSSWKSDAPYKFTHTGISGTISIGDLVTGATSGATGYIERTITSSKIYIQNITGTFQDAEQVYETEDINYVILSNAGTNTITLANGSYTDDDTTIWAGPIDTDLDEVIITNTIETNTSPARTFERSFKIKVEEK